MWPSGHLASRSRKCLVIRGHQDHVCSVRGSDKLSQIIIWNTTSQKKTPFHWELILNLLVLGTWNLEIETWNLEMVLGLRLQLGLCWVVHYASESPQKNRSKRMRMCVSVFACEFHLCVSFAMVLNWKFPMKNQQNVQYDVSNNTLLWIITFTF